MAHFTMLAGAVTDGPGTPYVVESRDAAVVIQVSGNFAATIEFEATADGVRYEPVRATALPDGNMVTSTAAPGLFLVPVGGFLAVRTRVSGYQSGAVTVIGRASRAQPVRRKAPLLLWQPGVGSAGGTFARASEALEFGDEQQHLAIRRPDIPMPGETFSRAGAAWYYGEE